RVGFLFHRDYYICPRKIPPSELTHGASFQLFEGLILFVRGQMNYVKYFVKVIKNARVRSMLWIKVVADPNGGIKTYLFFCYAQSLGNIQASRILLCPQPLMIAAFRSKVDLNQRIT